MNTRTVSVLLAVVSQYIVFATPQNIFPIVHKPALFKVLEALPEQDLPTVPATKEAHIESKAAPRCGEILTRSQDGGIFYKPFEQVIPNERCVWIIAPPSAAGFNITILYLGNQTNKEGTNQELIITAIGRPAYPGLPKRTSYKPTTTGFLNITSANILLVTFLSGVPNGTAFGFALQYDQQQNTSAPSNSTHHILETPVSEFKYPTNSLTYSNNELAVIVFAPVNNVYTGEEHHYAYKTLGLDDCFDAAHIYRLDTSVADVQDKWKFFTRFCHSDGTCTFSSDDLVLVIFQSDYSIVYGGFTLSSYP